MKLKNKSLLLLSLVLIFSILLGPNVHAFTTSVYTDQFTGARLSDIQTYSDGTGLITLTYTDPLKEGILAVRLIHPNGSLTAFDVPFRCNNPGKCPVISYPLGSNYLFVIHKTTEFNVDETTYGLVVDWNGRILSRYYDKFKC